MSASAAGATRADPPAPPRAAPPAARSRADPPGLPREEPSRADPILLGRLVPGFAASLDSRAPTGMLLAIENTS